MMGLDIIHLILIKLRTFITLSTELIIIVLCIMAIAVIVIHKWLLFIH